MIIYYIVSFILGIILTLLFLYILPIIYAKKLYKKVKELEDYLNEINENELK